MHLNPAFQRFCYVACLATLLALRSVGQVSAVGSDHGDRLCALKLRHPTKLRIHGASPDRYEKDLPEGVELVHYSGNGRQLLAWLARPVGPGLHPAVLYAHHGFALSHVDFEDARPFVTAGYLVLMPAWRAENGNAGEFQRYFGEVDDACEALQYLNKIPGVDPKRVFAAGDTMGGTTMLLLAESDVDVRLRMVAACSAFPDINEAIERGLTPQRKLFPYDFKDTLENEMRSPGRHLQDLDCPIRLYNSESDVLYVRQAGLLVNLAHNYGKDVTSSVYPHTSQRTVVSLAIRAMIREFDACR